MDGSNSNEHQQKGHPAPRDGKKWIPCLQQAGRSIPAGMTHLMSVFASPLLRDRDDLFFPVFASQGRRGNPHKYGKTPGRDRR